MHSLLSAPSEAGPFGRLLRTRGYARVPLVAFLLAFLSTAVSSFAQSQVATLSGVGKPTFVAIDANRTIGGVTATWLYVSDHGNTDNTGGGFVYRFNLTSGSTTPAVVASPGTGPGQFTSPDGILVDAATGDLIIADRAADRVQRITNTGTFVSSFGSSTIGAADEMHGPCGLATDSAGNIYVAEHGETLSSPPGANGQFVSKYNSAGVRQWRVGGTGTGNGQFMTSGPYGIAVSGSTVNVSDGFNSRVQALNAADGSYISQFSVPGALPLGLYLDSAGALWIAEATNSGNGSGSIQQVQKYTTSGTYANVTLSGGMNLPFDTAIDSSTNLAYVADWGNSRVDVFNLSSGGSVPAINSNASASGTVGQNFSYQITATNSPNAYAVASGSSLPGGLTLDANTGAITGIPGTAGTTTVNLTASNTSGTSAPFALAITISAAAPPPPSGPAVTFFMFDPSTITVNGPGNVSFSVDLTFNEAVTGVTANSFTFATSGNSTGTFNGVTPVDSSHYKLNATWTGGAPGALAFTIKSSGSGIIDGSSNAYAGAGITLAVVPISASPDHTLPTVTSFVPGAGVNGTVNFTLTFNRAVWDVLPTNFTVNASSGVSASLGAALQPADNTGTVFTVPVNYTGSSGTISLTVADNGTIQDGNGDKYVGPDTSSVFTIGSGGGGSAPTISNQIVAGTSGTALSYQVVATGATSFSVTGSPTLPAGLTMSASGLITGTPAASGTTNVSVQATNTNGSTPATLTFNIAAAGTVPSIADQTASGTQNTALSYQVQATGATSFSVTGATPLPAGLSMSSAGLVTGTPTGSGTTNVTVQATNTNGSSTAHLTINIAAAGAAPTIAPQTLNLTQGVPVSYQVQATGAATFAVSGTPALPASLAMSASGLITGTPIATGSTAVTIQVTNTNGTNSAAITINVAASGSAPTIATQTAMGTANIPLSYQVQAGGATSFAITSGMLPAGLSMSSSGMITGTPTATASATITVQATNSFGSNSATVTITIAAAPPAGTPVVTSASLTLTSGIPMVYNVSATNRPTAFTISGQPSSLTISKAGVISGTPVPTGTFTATVTATNDVGTGSGTITFNITPGSSGGIGGVTPAPTIANQSAAGTQNAAFGYQVQATGATSFAIVGTTALPVGLSMNSSGLISGTPTASGATTVSVQARNSGGNSTANVAIAIAAATPSPQSQTVTLVPPTSTIFISMPFQLAATTSSGLPATYTLVSGNATISGNMLTISGLGPVVVRASQAGNASFLPASTEATFNAQKQAQAIHASIGGTFSANQTVTLEATADSGLPVTYTLVSGPGVLSGNTLTFNNASGIVIVKASQAGNGTFNAAADMNLTFVVSQAGTQVYFGKLGSDDFAATVTPDGKSGMIVTRLGSTGEGLVVKFAVNADGSFSAVAKSYVTQSAGTAESINADATTPTTRTFSGMVANGMISGQVAELGVTFNGTVQGASGPTVAYTGLYTAMIPGSASGTIYLVVGSNGQAYALVVTPMTVASGTGTVSTSGDVSVTTSGSNPITVTATIDPARSAVTGSVKLPNAANETFAGISAATTATDRLVNISARVKLAGTGQTATAGFVVTGTQSKQFLIRAVGPGLASAGVTDGLPNPTLTLFDSNDNVLATNSGWNADPAISAAGDSVGAFKLTPGSMDAALLVTLAPGNYTAQVTSKNSGEVLVEVYDVASNAANPTKQLINISTRANINAAGDSVTGGFVVSGNEPKRVLIRAIGPSLAPFGVTGTITDPVLKVYDSTGKLVAQNDNWGTPQPIDGTQIAASAADITAADTASGAFPLQSGSTDAAVVITLNPGAYTAIISGANGATGATMIEVYEIPNL